VPARKRQVEVGGAANLHDGPPPHPGPPPLPRPAGDRVKGGSARGENCGAGFGKILANCRKYLPFWRGFLLSVLSRPGAGSGPAFRKKGLAPLWGVPAGAFFRRRAGVADRPHRHMGKTINRANQAGEALAGSCLLFGVKAPVLELWPEEPAAGRAITRFAPAPAGVPGVPRKGHGPFRRGDVPVPPRVIVDSRPAVSPFRRAPPASGHSLVPTCREGARTLASPPDVAFEISPSSSHHVTTR